MKPFPRNAAVSGGNFCQATGNSAVASGGFANTASGPNAVVSGGAGVSQSSNSGWSGGSYHTP